MIPVPGFEGRRVAVFGLGRSGITAARALQAGGAIPIELAAAAIIASFAYHAAMRDERLPRKPFTERDE